LERAFDGDFDLATALQREWGDDHEPATNTLYVYFVKGGCYRYLNVPEIVFHSLLEAESAGKFFAANIQKELPVRALWLDRRGLLFGVGFWTSAPSATAREPQERRSSRQHREKHFSQQPRSHTLGQVA